MKNWTRQRQASLAVHVFFVSVPFLASSISALLLWRTLFDSWWLAVPAVLVVDILTLTGLLLFILRIPSPFVPLRKALPFVSVVPLGRELYLLLSHNDPLIAVIVTLIAVIVLTAIAWQCFATIEQLFIDPVTAAREKAREQLEDVTLQIASLTEANAVIAEFVTAWRTQTVTAIVTEDRPMLSDGLSKSAKVRALAAQQGISVSTAWRKVASGELSVEEPTS